VTLGEFKTFRHRCPSCKRIFELGKWKKEEELIYGIDKTIEYCWLKVKCRDCMRENISGECE
jgi:hypothetical protein